MVAEHLYRHLCGAPANSAGIIVGDVPAPRSLALLAHWGIDATGHRPRQLSRHLCDAATAIFTMGPTYTYGLLLDYGRDLAAKTYLFADPFSQPISFGCGEYLVLDPGFDARPTGEVVPDYAWMRERVLAIRLSLLGYSPRPLVPASGYLELLSTVEPLRPSLEAGT